MPLVTMSGEPAPLDESASTKLLKEKEGNFVGDSEALGNAAVVMTGLTGNGLQDIELVR